MTATPITKSAGTLWTFGNYEVTIEQPETHKNILGAASAWTNPAADAYTFMNLIRKIALFLNEMGFAQSTGLVSRLGAYTGASAVPYFFSLVTGLPKTFRETFSEPMTAHRASGFAHHMFETGAMGAFSIGFFTNNSNPVVGAAGTVLDGLADFFDITTYGFDARDSHRALQQAKKLNLSEAVTDGLSAARFHSMLRVGKAATATANGCFAGYTLVTGAVLVKSATMASIGLLSALCKTASYYQKACFSEHFATRVSVVNVPAVA